VYGGARSELNTLKLESQELRAQMKDLAEALKAAPRGPAVKAGYIANAFHEALIPQDEDASGLAPQASGEG
jgi:hypothetical protein